MHTRTALIPQFRHSFSCINEFLDEESFCLFLVKDAHNYRAKFLLILVHVKAVENPLLRQLSF